MDHYEDLEHQMKPPFHTLDVDGIYKTICQYATGHQFQMTRVMCPRAHREGTLRDTIFISNKTVRP